MNKIIHSVYTSQPLSPASPAVVKQAHENAAVTAGMEPYVQAQWLALQFTRAGLALADLLISKLRSDKLFTLDYFHRQMDSVLFYIGWTIFFF